MNKKLSLLNLGCGNHYHPDWINCDVLPSNKSIIKIDVTNKLPFLSNQYDMVYCSHLIEHLSTFEAEQFLQECYRILKPGGILRIVTPNLEEIAKLYLFYFNKLKNRQNKFEKRYRWMLLEMFDQISREKPGGEMLKALNNTETIDKDFVIERIGIEAKNYWQDQHNHVSLLDKIFTLKKFITLYNLRHLLILTICILIGGRRFAKNYLVGLFRSMGEIHKTMYDSVSLNLILHKHKFIKIRIFNATRSNLKNYSNYHLDDLNGISRKPDSLYMEAIK